MVPMQSPARKNAQKVVVIRGAWKILHALVVGARKPKQSLPFALSMVMTLMWAAINLVQSIQSAMEKS
jgi:hypothetical protein